jgi:hypothetical protein
VLEKQECLYENAKKKRMGQRWSRVEGGGGWKGDRVRPSNGEKQVNY